MIAMMFSVSVNAATGGLYGTLSIIPGLGQAANGNVLEGFGWLVTSTSLAIGAKNERLRSIGQNIWFYNMYDAYRDASVGSNKVSGQNVFENAIAPYNPINLFDSIGAPVVGIAGSVAHGRNITPEKVVEFGFVGLGEEALFRGFLFPAFTNVFNQSKWTGAIVSSALFAGAHTYGNVVPRFVLGMLFCWQLDRNKYDLRNGIFAHAWWDVFVDSKSNINGGKVNYKIDF